MPEPEQPQDWIFTFGSGHCCYAAHSGWRTDLNDLGTGFPLDNRYVVIHATATKARSKMDLVFGSVWSRQYESLESAGVSEFGLTELVIA